MYPQRLGFVGNGRFKFSLCRTGFATCHASSGSLRVSDEDHVDDDAMRSLFATGVGLDWNDQQRYWLHSRVGNVDNFMFIWGSSWPDAGLFSNAVRAFDSRGRRGKLLWNLPDHG